MRILLLARHVATALLGLGLLACKEQPTATAPSANVSGAIADRGFEKGSLNVAGDGWRVAGRSTKAGFIAAGGYAGGFALTHRAATAYSVTTVQTVSGLANGYYTLSAWAENSGGQAACYLAASGYGGDPRRTSLPVSPTAWTQVVVRGIHVTNGSCAIALVSDAPAGTWSKLDEVQLVKDDKPYEFLKGGDISELSYIESKGGTFADSSGVKDCLEIMRAHGVNLVRLRLYNDPGNPGFAPSNRLPAGFQNPADVLALALRAHRKGMKIQLTFHYSDYWSGGASQPKPHDWVGLSYPDLKQALYDFTHNFMLQMQAQGTTPDYVSLGDEIAGGIVFPEGKTSSWPQLAGLLQQGYAAVKSVSPSTQVVLHLDDAGNASKYNSFFGNCATYGVPYDVIGASYYPFWTQKTVAQIRDWANATTARFNKDILIMETGYNWSPVRPNGYTGQLVNNGPYDSIYPSSPAGQRDFLLECFNGLKTVDNGRVIGDIYWDPVMIAAPGVGWELGAQNVVSNTTLFDFQGVALPAFTAFRNN